MGASSSLFFGGPHDDQGQRTLRAFFLPDVEVNNGDALSAVSQPSIRRVVKISEAYL